MKKTHIKQVVLNIFKIVTLLSCVLIPFASCTNTKRIGGISSTAHANILDYKNSDHHLFVGFLVGDGNDPIGGFNPANAPDSVDFLELFAGFDTSKADWRTAQAKGTRIVYTHFMNNAYFDGSIKDPATMVTGYVNPTGFNQTKSNTTSSYTHWARDMYMKHIVRDKLDGIDMDIESGTFGGDVAASNGDSLLVAVARYFGPNCTLCTVNTGGRKPVFFYDTDGTASTE